MRRVLGYENGRPIWSENEPAYAASSSRGGSLVVAASRPRRRSLEAQMARRYRERTRAACVLTGRCRHMLCVASRVEEVRRLHATTNLTLAQIGLLMGGRDHSTIHYWIHEYRDRVA